MSKSVTEFTTAEVPLLKDFLLEAWQQAGPLSFGWTGATDENISEMSSEKFLKGLASNNSLRVFVKKDHQEILGFCATRMIDAKSIELAGIIIPQDCVGKGIGTALFELARTKAVEAGYNTMFVKTESSNQQALFFYKKREFVEQSEVIEEVNCQKVNLTLLKLPLQSN